MIGSSTERPRPAHAIGANGAYLFAAFATAQGCAFLRNAVIGHTLSKGDFGVAATITLILQLVEMISDLGSDRLIVQAADGARARFLAASHAVLIARGIALTLLLLAVAPGVANALAIPHATAAFLIVAFGPLVKGLVHLDYRRAQRRFDNGPFIALEAGPQAGALALTPLALHLSPDYHAVAWLTLAQAAIATLISHYMARAPYRIVADAGMIKRHVIFGWPILASALPLVAVVQGDRMIVASMQGMEALAAYTAAFMITMAPALLASKVGHALMLPLFAASLRTTGALGAAFREMTDLTILAAAIFVSIFIVAGGALLPLAFGPNYSGYAQLTSMLAVMWSLRMVQAVPGMALMARGETVPLLTAGVIRAAALPFVLWAALSGASLASLAAIGAAFELASLAFVAWRIGQLEAGLSSAFAGRTSVLLAVGCLAACTQWTLPGGASSIATTIASLLLAIAACFALLPSLRRAARQWIEQGLSAARLAGTAVK
jgi:O-antigen/teichoic acid export membrane protein